MSQKLSIKKFRALQAEKEKHRKRFSKYQTAILKLAKQINALEAKHGSLMSLAQAESDKMAEVQSRVMSLPDDVLRNFGIWRDRGVK